jgi:PHS family inorganic phosphate transporter-like MFS transporter
MGFTMMTVCLLILAIAYNPLREHAIWAFIFIYALMFFFANFGPNTTTFIIPGECFPTRYRSTCHGLSAASGKAGAIVGLYAFGNIATNYGYPTALGMLAVFMFAGLLCTYFVPETQGKSLEELGGELEQEEAVKAVEQPAAAAAEEPRV